MDSNAGLVTGEYFLDHQLVTYQSQGQAIGIDLQYSSAQADPTPVVEYQFTTPMAGNSSAITSINAQVTLAGVTQGTTTTYNTPGGLTDGETYNIPPQVDAAALPTGVYSYTMTVTEDFGSDPGAVSITGTNVGSVNVVNAAGDPLGAGWSIGGLQQLAQLTTDGPVLMAAGQQGTERFDPVYSEGQSSIQDLAVVDGTQSAQVLANDATGTFPAPGLPPPPMPRPPGSQDVAAIATATGDFNGDGRPDLAVIGSTSLSILLNDGSGGFTDGAVYALPSGYDARGVVVGNFSGHTGGVLDSAVLMDSTTDAYVVAEYTGDGDGTSYGVPTEITDFDGNTTTFALDSHGNVLEEMQPGGVDQEWTYNSAGQVTTHTDADGNTTTYVYDPDLAGPWFIGDLGTQIQQDGSSLTFINKDLGVRPSKDLEDLGVRPEDLVRTCEDLGVRTWGH